MSRTRMTQVRDRKAGKSVLAEIAEVERELTALDSDSKLLSDAESLAKEEVAIVTESGGENLSEDIGDENARANDNWPLQASERNNIARRLVALAKKLVD